MDLRDLADPRRRERLRAHLSGQFAGRPVICGIAPLAGMRDQVSMLGRAGARRPLLLYSSRGAGPARRTARSTPTTCRFRRTRP